MIIWGVWQTWTATPPMYSEGMLTGRGGWRILCDAALQVGVDISRGNFQSQKVTTEQIFKFSFCWQSKYVLWQNRIYEIEFRLDKRILKKVAKTPVAQNLKEMGVVRKMDLFGHAYWWIEGRSLKLLNCVQAKLWKCLLVKNLKIFIPKIAFVLWLKIYLLFGIDIVIFWGIL